MDLNREEETCLRELLDEYEKGTDVYDFINNRIFKELATYGEPDSFNVRPMTKLPGHDEQKSIYESLVEKGMLKGARPERHSWYWSISLTSEGRCYFSEKKKRKREARKARWSERRFTIFMALLTFTLSLMASWLIANRVVDSALSPLLGS